MEMHYKGERIRVIGRGFSYDGSFWASLEPLTQYIDRKKTAQQQQQLFTLDVKLHTAKAELRLWFRVFVICAIFIQGAQGAKFFTDQHGGRALDAATIWFTILALGSLIVCTRMRLHKRRLEKEKAALEPSPKYKTTIPNENSQNA